MPSPTPQEIHDYAVIFGITDAEAAQIFNGPATVSSTGGGGVPGGLTGLPALPQTAGTKISETSRRLPDGSIETTTEVADGTGGTRTIIDKGAPPAEKAAAAAPQTQPTSTTGAFSEQQVREIVGRDGGKLVSHGGTFTATFPDNRVVDYDPIGFLRDGTIGYNPTLKVEAKASTTAPSPNPSTTLASRIISSLRTPTRVPSRTPTTAPIVPNVSPTAGLPVGGLTGTGTTSTEDLLGMLHAQTGGLRPGEIFRLPSGGSVGKNTPSVLNPGILGYDPVEILRAAFNPSFSGGDRYDPNRPAFQVANASQLYGYGSPGYLAANGVSGLSPDTRLTQAEIAGLGSQVRDLFAPPALPSSTGTAPLPQGTEIPEQWLDEMPPGLRSGGGLVVRGPAHIVDDATGADLASIAEVRPEQMFNHGGYLTVENHVPGLPRYDDGGTITPNFAKPDAPAGYEYDENGNLSQSTGNNYIGVSTAPTPAGVTSAGVQAQNPAPVGAAGFTSIPANLNFSQIDYSKAVAAGANAGDLANMAATGNPYTAPVTSIGAAPYGQAGLTVGGYDVGGTSFNPYTTTTGPTGPQVPVGTVVGKDAAGNPITQYSAADQAAYGQQWNDYQYNAAMQKANLDAAAANAALNLAQAKAGLVSNYTAQLTPEQEAIRGHQQALRDQYASRYTHAGLPQPTEIAPPPGSWGITSSANLKPGLRYSLQTPEQQLATNAAPLNAYGQTVGDIFNAMQAQGSAGVEAALANNQKYQNAVKAYSDFLLATGGPTAAQQFEALTPEQKAAEVLKNPTPYGNYAGTPKPVVQDPLYAMLAGMKR